MKTKIKKRTIGIFSGGVCFNNVCYFHEVTQIKE